MQKQQTPQTLTTTSSNTAGVPAIDLRGVTKRFTTPTGATYTALRDLDLQVAPGEFCAIVGPTGCGKSTTLTLVSGLERPSLGTVRVHGRDVAGITPGVAFMFQTDAVLPWKTVLDNVALGPRFRGTAKAKANATARDWLRRVGLAGFEDRFPHQLSGGMRKRVALAQSLINEPQILLMDEPFGSLDAITRQELQDEVCRIARDDGRTVVFVTHDLEEAIYLGDRVVALAANPGRIAEIVDIELPRPRRQLETREDARFLQYRHRLYKHLGH